METATTTEIEQQEMTPDKRAQLEEIKANIAGTTIPVSLLEKVLGPGWREETGRGGVLHAGFKSTGYIIDYQA